ncbi:MAG TPA: ABC transporter permease [Candidatus Eisenbacteria bacterium]|nr:ABC transporter permease [Candidatus Eisenbacteria bacterium]
MPTLLQDLRYALRQLRHAPTFTLTALLTLAIGIGATTAIFTLTQAIMLKSLPVADPAQLYRIGDTSECCIEGWEDDDWSLFSFPLYQRLVAAAPEFEETTAFQADPGIYSIRREAEDREARPLRTEYVSGTYFHVFGIGAFAGRVISNSDDQPSAPPVAMISYRTWQQAYGSDPKTVGSTFFVQGQAVTLVGITPPGFFGDTLRSDPPDFWLPLQQEALFDGQNAQMRTNQPQWLYAIGRLKPGASVQALPARLTLVLQRWLRDEDEMPAEFRPQIDPTIPQKYIRLAPAGAGVTSLRENYGDSLRILLMVCGTLLLIACANLANLLLARGASRRAQTAVRLALGAARTRLIRQQLTEAVLLSVLGGIAGLGISYAGARLMLALAFHSATFTPISAAPSLPVLGFAFALSLLTGVLFGVVPAWVTSRSDPAQALHGAGRGTRAGASLPQKILVVSQAALSLVLLACAGLLTMSLRNLERQDFGFDVQNRMSVEINPPLDTYTPEHLDALYRAIEDGLVRLPNVQSASLAAWSPLSGNNWGEMIAVEGRGDPKADLAQGVSWDRVSRQYFSTIGQRIVRGRDFAESDSASSPPVAIVNESLVRKYFPNEDPIGKHFGLDNSRYAGTYEIVGVARDAKYNDPDQPAKPMFFVPLEQSVHYRDALMERGEIHSHFVRTIQLLVRGHALNLEPQLRKALADIDPNLTIITVQSMNEQVASNFDQQRMVAQLAGTFGLIAMLLAAIGLYGLTAYTVTCRTSEIGVRMAVGADRLNIVRLVLRGAFLLVAIGLLIGIPLAMGAGRLMAAQLFEIRSWDPRVFGFSILALGACSAAASILPARRAASTDPMKALRTD